MRLGRRVEFEASHFYRLPELSDAENRLRFGKVANAHGHNYVLHVEAIGTTDPRTGMVVNIKDIDALLEERVVAQLDHKCLNLDHPAFRHRLPTTENIALFVWNELDGQLPQVDLSSVRLCESDSLWAETRGETSVERRLPVAYLTRVYDFSASHRLHEPRLSDAENVALYGKCNNPNGHGHNYRVEVTLRGELDERTGTIADLNYLDDVARNEIVERFDCKHLNTDVDALAGVVPTSENVVKALYELLAPHFADGAKLHRVRLYETPKSWFDYGELS
jgi:6-pyruvoyltetrahydropterin/6-carboxytetrahydropterin synthase